MNRFVVPMLVVSLWLFAWASDTGLLVWSSVEKYRHAGDTRVCWYFLGLSVERVERGEAWRYARCPLLSRIR